MNTHHINYPSHNIIMDSPILSFHDICELFKNNYPEMLHGVYSYDLLNYSFNESVSEIY